MASGEGLAVDGKVMWIRVGSQIYRVSTDMAIMSDTEFDQTGELVDETEEAQEEVRPRRSRKVKFGIIEVAENSGDNGTDGQPEPEAGTGGGPKPQDPSGQNYGNGEAPLGPEGSLSQVRPVEPSGPDANPSLSGNVTGNDDENHHRGHRRE